MSEEIILKIVENVGDDAKAIVITLSLFNLLSNILVPLAIVFIFFALAKIATTTINQIANIGSVLEEFDLVVFDNSPYDLKKAKAKIKQWKAKESLDGHPES